MGVKNNMKMIDTLDVLRRIEEIVADDFSADIEWDLSFGKLETEKEKILAEKLGKVYMLAHAWNPSNGCYSVHDDWRKT